MGTKAQDLSESVVAVRVSPRSSRPGVAKWDGSVLRVNLSSPPVDGKANRELIRVISKEIGVARSCIELAAGTANRDKRLRVVGISQTDLQDRLDRFRRNED